jgi:hypothetical protein
MTVTLADRGPSIVAVDAVFLALSSISVLLRCYCRLYVIRKFAIDDWFALLSWVCEDFSNSYCTAEFSDLMQCRCYSSVIVHSRLRLVSMGPDSMQMLFQLQRSLGD